MKQILVYHHNDLDGIASAAIVNFYNKSSDGVSDCTVRCIAYDYVDDSVINIKEASNYDLVYVVDMALQPFSRMVDLAKSAKVIWIDHHVGFLREYDKLPDDEKKLFHSVYLGADDNMKSACELTLEYFTRLPHTCKSRGIKDISRVDTWHHNDDPNVWAFFEYADYHLHDPYHPKWDLIICDTDSFYRKAIHEGVILKAYRQHGEDKHASENSMEIMFEGYKCIALNSSSFGSQQFGTMYDPTKHKMMIRFARARGAWKFSMYTTHDDIDLSVIGKKYGGGGHRKASGFTIRTDELPFILG